MGNLIESEAEQRSEDWYTLRIGRLSASQMKAFMSDKWRENIGTTRIVEALANQRMGMIDEIDIPETDAVKKGMSFEPIALEMARKVTTLDFVNCSTFWRDDREDFLATPDAVVRTKGGGIEASLEMKTRSSAVSFASEVRNWKNQNKIQMECQALVLKNDSVWFFSTYVGDYPEDHEKQGKAVRIINQLVEDGEVPTMDGYPYLCVQYTCDKKLRKSIITRIDEVNEAISQFSGENSDLPF